MTISSPAHAKGEGKEDPHPSLNLQLGRVAGEKGKMNKISKIKSWKLWLKVEYRFFLLYKIYKPKMIYDKLERRIGKASKDTFTRGSPVESPVLMQRIIPHTRWMASPQTYRDKTSTFFLYVTYKNQNENEKGTNLKLDG